MMILLRSAASCRSFYNVCSQTNAILPWRSRLSTKRYYLNLIVSRHSHTHTPRTNIPPPTHTHIHTNTDKHRQTHKPTHTHTDAHVYTYTQTYQTTCRRPTYTIHQSPITISSLLHSGCAVGTLTSSNFGPLNAITLRTY